MSNQTETSRERRDQWFVATALSVAVAAAVGFMVIYVAGAQTQWAGVCLAVSLAALGTALIWWAHRLLDLSPATDHREALSSEAAERRGATAAFDADDVLERRPFLRRFLLGAASAIAIAAVFPFRSLGPRPTRSVPWRAGTRLVDGEGRPINIADVPYDSLVTAFPEGNLESADGPTLLIRVRSRLIGHDSDRDGWSPEGLLAFSKVCTHAGCPVGLYEARSKTLLCPCHQSEFDVLHQARPTSGPAAAPLPQLPLRITTGGIIEAAGEFSSPVGPASWFDK